MNNWTIAIHWGWRDAGNLPNEVNRGLPSEVQQGFTRADEDAGDGQLYFVTIHKALGQDSHTSRDMATLAEVTWSRRGGDVSLWTEATEDTFQFLSAMLTDMSNPQTEWLYVLFLNRMMRDDTQPPTMQKRQLQSASEGFGAFINLVAGSTYGDKPSDWILLRLIRDDAISRLSDY